jgi:hypothetical protein
MEVERDKEGHPKMYGKILTVKYNPKDPFINGYLVGPFGLGLARYTFARIDEDQNEQKKKKEKR